MLQTFCVLLKLIFKATQVSDLFQCQIKYAFVHAYLFIIDVYNIFNNKIAKLNGSRTKLASNIKL